MLLIPWLLIFCMLITSTIKFMGLVSLDQIQLHFKRQLILRSFCSSQAIAKQVPMASLLIVLLEEYKLSPYNQTRQEEHLRVCTGDPSVFLISKNSISTMKILSQVLNYLYFSDPPQLQVKFKHQMVSSNNLTVLSS